MSTNWTPTTGMRRAHDLVERIAAEAGAAESMISDLYKHRMVDLIAGEIDEAVHLALSEVLHRAEAASGTPTPPDADFSELDELDQMAADATIGCDVPVDAGVRAAPTNGHAKGRNKGPEFTGAQVLTAVQAGGQPGNVPAYTPAPRNRSKKAKGKGSKKGTLKLGGAERRLAEKRIREEAARNAALDDLPVPIDGMERM
jgi:hypothetical protein